MSSSFTTPSSSCKRPGAGQTERNSSQKQATTSVAVTPSRLKCISDLKGELTCGICLDICVKPCSTPCGHNFCQRCLQALYRTSCANSQKTFVECPKCRKSIGKIDEISRRLQQGTSELEVNSALWNVIQMLFPHVDLKSPQWKLKQITPQHQNRRRGRGLGLGAAYPTTPSEEEEAHSDFVHRARLMLQLTTTTTQDAAGDGLGLNGSEVTFVDDDDFDGSEGPVLDMSNLRPAMREVFFNNQARLSGISGAEREREREGEGEGEVPRAGFTTAREILMRSNASHHGQAAPHEIIEYA